MDIITHTSTIVFNTVDLELDHLAITLADSKTRILSAPTFDKIMGRASVNLPSILSAGSKAQLQVGFRGKLTSSMQGYYKSGWEHEGNAKYYALTQFEVLGFNVSSSSFSQMPDRFCSHQPTAARRAFPCWDEPLLKATFAISLISRENTVNLSNMSASSEKPYEPKFKEDPGSAVSSLTQWFSSLNMQDTNAKEKWKITKFETTPPVRNSLHKDKVHFPIW